MVTKKDLVIAVIVTFCLTATLFFVIPTWSSTNGYDSWLDSNDDGAINILDISAVAKAWQTTGDPTKSVNIASHAAKLIKHQNVSINTNETWSSGLILVDGYTKININLVTGTTGAIDYWLVSASDSEYLFVVDIQIRMDSNYLVKSYDVMNMYMRVDIRNNWITTYFYLDIYLIA